ncbi:unnamed protein product [Linum tenue]|uniref:Fe2OG dioxygenase domain-containing protein n=1 Tax=Linum tenue TaxID=586396 RepID=A0AAV0NHI5_9ROSI|nr:unnamed protein product [Linum tenue]
MEAASTHKPAYDRLAELKSFDETKAGVKGLADAGITHLPRIFHAPPHLLDNISPSAAHHPNSIFPIIDLEGASQDPAKRNAIVNKLSEASANWGFFQIVNHGIPLTTLDEMKSGVRRFHEQDAEQRRQFYTRNFSREIVAEYSAEVVKLGDLLFELLSEALGLRSNYLKDLDCGRGIQMVCHYYPACPQPELTLGATKHADNDFITVLLQDHIGGLQVLHQGKWIDVPPLPEALVINIGDFLQLISNDKFISVEHRVLANSRGPRVSVACLFGTYLFPNPRKYGPIEELLSAENPAKYRETTTAEYVCCGNDKGLDGSSTLLQFKL